MVKSIPSVIVIIIVLVIALILAVFVFISLKQEGKEISLEEKGLIETWIIENNLNQYGDLKDTFYTGGTPLFDEKTGKAIDKYEYIVKNHSDAPWLKK